MSTKPMSGVARQLEEAISQLHEAKKQLADLDRELQRSNIDTPEIRRALEAIDDRLHDALGALGD